MSRALLLGGSFSAVPIFRAIKDLGVEVELCSVSRGEPLHDYNLRVHEVDYSNVKEVEKIVRDQEIDFVVPTCNDTAYKTALDVANTYSLPGFDTLIIGEIISNKLAFRKRFSNSEVSMPYTLNSIDKNLLDSMNLKFPLLMKPGDGFSGIGISEIRNIDELKEAIESEHVNLFSIEERISGSLHSHSSFLRNREIAIDFFVDEFCIRNQYQVDCSNHPSILTDKIKEKMRVQTRKIAIELELVDGLLHTQFLVRDEEIYVIESMRRCPGDLYGDLIEKSTNFSYYESYVSGFLGLQPSIKSVENSNIPMIRHTIAKSKSGRFENLKIYPSDLEIEIIPIIRTGEQIFDNYQQKIGIGFLFPENLNQMKKFVVNSNTFFRVNFEDGS